MPTMEDVNSINEEVRQMALSPHLPSAERRAELAARCRELARSMDLATRNDLMETAELIEAMKW